MSHTYNAIRGHFGSLDTYLIQIRPAEIPEIVGHDPRDLSKKRPKDLRQGAIHDLYDKVQRGIETDLVEELREYVEQYSQPDSEGVGALPALAVGMTMPLDFRPFEGQDVVNGVVGRLTIPSYYELPGKALYLDGLKRACAVLACYQPEDGSVSILDPVNIAVMIFVPKPGHTLSEKDLKQLFYDFNSKATPITRQQAITRDSRDPYLQLARALAESEVLIKNGGVDTDRVQLKKGGVHVATFSNMVTFVRGALEGQAAADQARKSGPNLTKENLDSFKGELLSFLGSFVEGMTPEKFKDQEEHFHLMAAGWMALGVIFHEIRIRRHITGEALAEYGRRTGRIPWRNDAPLWTHLRVQKTDARGVVKYGWLVQGSHVPGREIVKVLRKELGLIPDPAIAAE